MRAEAGLPDWRDAAAYRPLFRLDRGGFAWEWLRRHPRYRADAAGNFFSGRPPFNVRVVQSAASAWGLHCFEDPDLASPLARPVWRRDRCRFVLPARSIRSTVSDGALDLERLSTFGTIVCGGRHEHLLLSDGHRSIRLDLRGASVRLGPVSLLCELHGPAGLEAPLMVLRRLSALVRAGSFGSSLHPPFGRARRHVLLLRTRDALAAGSGQREIAGELLDRTAARDRWRVEVPSVRLQAQRLVQGARRMAAGGFWDLLR